MIRSSWHVKHTQRGVDHPGRPHQQCSFRLLNYPLTVLLSEMIHWDVITIADIVCWQVRAQIPCLGWIATVLLLLALALQEFVWHPLAYLKAIQTCLLDLGAARGWPCSEDHVCRWGGHSSRCSASLRLSPPSTGAHHGPCSEFQRCGSTDCPETQTEQADRTLQWVSVRVQHGLCLHLREQRRQPQPHWV